MRQLPENGLSYKIKRKKKSFLRKHPFFAAVVGLTKIMKHAALTDGEIN